jgi:hypothetical protein
MELLVNVDLIKLYWEPSALAKLDSSPIQITLKNASVHNMNISKTPPVYVILDSSVIQTLAFVSVLQMNIQKMAFACAIQDSSIIIKPTPANVLPTSNNYLELAIVIQDFTEIMLLDPAYAQNSSKTSMALVFAYLHSFRSETVPAFVHQMK